MRTVLKTALAALAAVCFALPAQADYAALGRNYTYVFRGTEDANWATLGNWYTTADNGATWTVRSGTTAPGTPSSNDWESTLLDGDLMADTITVTGNRKEIVGVALEGWQTRIGVANGVHLTIPSLKKFQGGSCDWRVDATSKITVTGAVSGGNSGGDTHFYVDAAEGIVFREQIGSGGAVLKYHLGTAGSVIFEKATGNGSHTVASVVLDCGDATLGGKAIRRRKLVGFASSGQTFAYTAAGVTAQTSDGTPVTVVEKQTTVASSDAVGTYAFEKRGDGYYVDYVAHGEEGAYERTLDGGALQWQDEGAWAHLGESASAPAENGTAALTVSADTTLTMNAAAILETLNVEGVGKLTFSAEGTNALTATFAAVNADVDASSGVDSLGAVSIAEGKTLTVAKNGVFSALSGAGGVTLDATSGAIAASASTLDVLRTFSGTVTLEGTADHGVTLDYGTDVGSEFGPRLVVASGAHAMSYGRDSGELFATGDDDEHPTIRVKNGATLNFTGRDLSGWNGAANASGVIRVEQGGTLNFLQKDSRTLYWRQRLLLDPGASVTIAESFNDSGNFRLHGGTATEATAQLAVPAAEAGAAPATLSGGNLTLAHDDTKGLGIAVGTNAELRVEAVIANTDNAGDAALAKYGAGRLTFLKANTYAGPTTVNAGTLRVEGEGSLGTGVVTVAEGAEVAFANGGTVANTLSGAGALVKTGTGATTITGDLSAFTGTVTVEAGSLDVTSATLGETSPAFALAGGTLTVSSGAEGRVTSVAEGATLKIRLTDDERNVLGYVATGLPEGVRPVFVGADGAEITEGVSEDGLSYAAPVNTWTPTVPLEEGGSVFAWDDAQNWSAGAVPAEGVSVRVRLGGTAVTLLLPSEGASVGNMAIMGEGSLTFSEEGGKLTVGDRLLCEADVSGEILKLSVNKDAGIQIADGKTLTLSSETVVEDPDGFGRDHSITLPALTGEGRLVKTGTGAVALFNRAVEPQILVSEGVLHIRNTPSTRLDVTAEAGTEVRLTAWGCNFGNSLNAFRLKGGSKFVLANGSSGVKTVNGTVMISEAGETPARIYGSSFNPVALGGTLVLAEGEASGWVEFAEGEAFGSGGSSTKYPCNNEVQVTGTISGNLSVRISDLANPVLFSGANTYTGGTEIAEGAVLAISNREALGSGPTTGAGMLRSTAGIPANRNGLGEDGWTGRVVLASDITFADNADDTLGACGNPASTIELAGANRGYLKPAGRCRANLVLSGSMTVNDGWSSNGGYVFSGTLTGAGTLATSGAPTDVLQFTGTTSGFSGTVTVEGGHCVAFGEQVDDDTAAGKIVVASGRSVTVADGKTWRAVNGLLAKGNLSGTGTVDCALTFAEGATLDASAGALTVTGALTLPGGLAVALPEAPVLDGSVYLLKCAAADATPENAAKFALAQKGLAVRAVTEGTPGFVLALPRPQGADQCCDAALDALCTFAHANGLEEGFAVRVRCRGECLEDIGAANAALGCFTGLALTQVEGENAVEVAYDFGIERMTIREMASAEGAPALYVVLAAKVRQNAGTEAYAEGTEVQVLMNGEPVEAEAIEPPEGEATAANVRWFRLPYDPAAGNSRFAGEGTHTFKVRATNTTAE